MLRILVFMLLTWSVSEAYADTNLENNYNSGATRIEGDAKTVSKDNKIEGGTTSVTILGKLTITDDTKLEIKSGATVVVGSLTIGEGTKKTDVMVKGSSVLIVKGDLTLNDEAKLNIEGEGEGEGEGPIVVVQGDLIINGSTKPTEVFAKKGAIVVVEGNLILNGNNNENKIKVEEGASITIKHQISGTGKIEFPGPDAGKKGYFTALGGLATGTTMDNIKIEIPEVNKLSEAENLLYIDGVGDITISGPGGPGGEGPEAGANTKTINASNTSSTAYTTSIANLESLAALGFLPIELTSFTVSATEYGYTFNWVTASEENNDYFTLEYSINGVDFNEIDYVLGAGTTSQTSEYEYVWDAKPTADILYFRLKQTDYNGEYTYSDVIVSCRKKSAGATRMFRYGPLNLQVVDGELRYIENK